MDKQSVRKVEALTYQPPEEMFWRYIEARHTASLAAMKEARELFEEVKKYLVLVAILRLEEPNIRISPSRAVDDMWHHFILDNTEEYFAYCTRLLGAPVHHHAGNLYDQDKLFAGAKRLGLNLSDKWWGNVRVGVQCG